MAKFESAFSKKLALLLGHPTSTKIVLAMLRDIRLHPLVALNIVHDYLEGTYVPLGTLEVQGVRYYTSLTNYDVCGRDVFNITDHEPEIGMANYTELSLTETIAQFDNKGILYLELYDDSMPTICYVLPEDKYYIKSPSVFFP